MVLPRAFQYEAVECEAILASTVGVKEDIIKLKSKITQAPEGSSKDEWVKRLGHFVGKGIRLGRVKTPEHRCQSCKAKVGQLCVVPVVVIAAVEESEENDGTPEVLNPEWGCLACALQKSHGCSLRVDAALGPRPKIKCTAEARDELLAHIRTVGGFLMSFKGTQNHTLALLSVKALQEVKKSIVGSKEINRKRKRDDSGPSLDAFEGIDE